MLLGLWLTIQSIHPGQYAFSPEQLSSLYAWNPGENDPAPCGPYWTEQDVYAPQATAPAPLLNNKPTIQLIMQNYHYTQAHITKPFCKGLLLLPPTGPGPPASCSNNSADQYLLFSTKELSQARQVQQTHNYHTEKPQALSRFVQQCIQANHARLLHSETTQCILQGAFIAAPEPSYRAYHSGGHYVSSMITMITMPNSSSLGIFGGIHTAHCDSPSRSYGLEDFDFGGQNDPSYGPESGCAALGKSESASRAVIVTSSAVRRPEMSAVQFTFLYGRSTTTQALPTRVSQDTNDISKQASERTRSHIFHSCESVLLAIIMWLLASWNCQANKRLVRMKIYYAALFLKAPTRARRIIYLRSSLRHQQKILRSRSRLVFTFTLLIVCMAKLDHFIPTSFVPQRVRWRKRFRLLPSRIKVIGAFADNFFHSVHSSDEHPFSAFVSYLYTAQPIHWTRKYYIAHAILISQALATIGCNANVVFGTMIVLSICKFFREYTKRNPNAFPCCKRVLNLIILTPVSFLATVIAEQSRNEARALKRIILPLGRRCRNFCIFLTLHSAILMELVATFLYAVPSNTWLFILLLLCGDIHPNPRPPNHKTSSSIHQTANLKHPSNVPLPAAVSETLKILNWNARGIGGAQDHKQRELLKYMDQNDIQISIITETRETVGKHSQPQIHQNGFTIYKASYHDKSHTAKFLSPDQMVWGVCLIVKSGLAFTLNKISNAALGARVVHGTLTIPSKSHKDASNIFTPTIIDIIGVYGPATKDHSVNEPFWAALENYVRNIHKNHVLEFHNGTRQIILAGDWNSYQDPNMDIYREYELSSPEQSDSNLQAFLTNLYNEGGIYLTDLMAASKLAPYSDYTYATKTLSYRSILDRIFTTIGKQHCDPTQVLDFGINMSDHRPVLASINLHSLCDGWLEYPQNQFRLPRININVENEKKMSQLCKITDEWSRMSGKRTFHAMTYDTVDSMQTRYEELQKVFVELPAKAFPPTTQKRKDWKSKAQGLAEANLRWIIRYLRAVKHLRDCKLGRKCLGFKKDQHIQRVWRDFEALQSPIAGFAILDANNYQTWSIQSCEDHISAAESVLTNLKACYDKEVFADKKQQKDAMDRQHRSHRPNSKKKRLFHMPHKYAATPLPSIMKRNDGTSGFVSGEELNESWGHQLDLNSSFQMPRIPTEQAPPWLQDDLWKDTRNRLAPHQASLMDPITKVELATYVKNVGTPAPGIDRIQFEVIRVMLYHKGLQKHNFEKLLLDFVNTILATKSFPSTMKNALLIFIPKDGDPLLHTNYRGIALLSSIYKIITGVLNARLTKILHDHGGIEVNQGGTKKESMQRTKRQFC